MARPVKEGIDYFPLDCSLDTKFELIEAEYGLTGFAVVVKLYQRIYGGLGYYCEWTKEVALLFAKSVGLGGSVVSEIVSASVSRGIFDKTLFDKYGILTSRGIQKRYFEAVSRRKQLGVINEYLLVEVGEICKSADINTVNVNIYTQNARDNTQSKVKESKVEKRKEVAGGDITGAIKSQALKDKLDEWLKYKRERREGYREEGLKALVAQTDKAARAYGEAAVCSLIAEAMSNGYKGITWDKLRDKPGALGFEQRDYRGGVAAANSIIFGGGGGSSGGGNASCGGSSSGGGNAPCGGGNDEG